MNIGTNLFSDEIYSNIHNFRKHLWKSNAEGSLLILILVVTCEVVEPWTCLLSSSPPQALWTVATILMLPYSALVLGVSTPVQAGPCVSVCWSSPSLILSCFVVELKITGSGVVRTLPGWTERGPERRALPRTAGSLAASHVLRGVVRVAAGDVARVFGVCERVVKEVHWGRSCRIS